MGKSEINISFLGPQGDGVHLSKRGKVYVERSAPGDVVVADIRQDRFGKARGEIIEVLKPSLHRQEPPCPYYELCGNCTLQHLNEKYYRNWKEELVKQAFEKNGLRPKQWLETKFIEQNARRRVTFSAIKKNGRLNMGYYRRRSQEITDIDSCLVADSRLLQLRDQTIPYLKNILKEGKSADIFLQVVEGSVDMVLTGYVGTKGAPDPLVLAQLKKLLETTDINRISWREKEEAEIEILFTKGRIEARFGELKVGLPPDAFLQPTLQGEKGLVEAVMKALPKEGKFLDLFSGCGTFTGPMLSQGSVDAFELSLPAARALSKAGGKKALKAWKRDLFKNPLKPKELNEYDAAVFDPPRAGCLEQATQLSRSRVPLLIGVSCNPVTFARDAQVLSDGGYRLESLQVFDQFLWSHHVETVGVFTKTKS